jgi:hypothetical protein
LAFNDENLDKIKKPLFRILSATGEASQNHYAEEPEECLD